jgi:hypothetical protein
MHYEPHKSSYMNDRNQGIMMYSQNLKRATSERPERCVDDAHASQGKVMWLRAKDELPDRAVKRAHGKGPVEEGIYDHPVVVVSRPLGDNREVHFYLVSMAIVKKRLRC